MAMRLFIIILLLCTGPGAAAPLVKSGQGRVVEVVDGDTLFLDDGVQVRLVGIQAPKLPLGRRNFKTWPLAEEAKRALETLSLDRVVKLSYGGRRTDRYGRALAHLHREDGLWLQEQLLRQGMARVYSFRDNRAVVPEMLAAEQAAREGKLGIWGPRWYRIWQQEELHRGLEGFFLIEGTVLKTAQIRGRIYLNFGQDWRQDFTITIAPRDRKLFERSGFAHGAMVGQRLRVRGWLKHFNGPSIEATHPEQIELLNRVN
ncbi:MAG: thermonuclease family protein [Alphaproteobacteria bacterium]|nr:thermonuclease family protein [Alphaproteobacteria bacterium]